MAQTQTLKETGDKKPSPRGKKPADLSGFYAIPLVSKKIDSGLYQPDEIRGYILTIKHVFGNVENFSKFLALDADMKGKFLMDWAAAYIAKRSANAEKLLALNHEDAEAIAKISDNDRKAFNTGWNAVWKVQGFFSNVLNEQHLINTTRFPQFIPNSAGKPLRIKIDDILDVFEVLKPKAQLVLKLQTLYGAQPVDLIDLKVADFQDCGDDFYYIVKYRKKTYQKNTVWFALVPAEIVELARLIAKVEGKSIAEPFFAFTSESSVKSAYDYAAKVYGVPSLDTPELRRWNATTLSKYLKVAEKEVFVAGDPETTIDREDILHFWTQHDVEGVLSVNYIREHIIQMKRIFPWIADGLMIHSTHTFTKKFAQVKKEAKDIMEQQRLENEKVRNEALKNTNTTNELLLELIGKMGEKNGVKITARTYTNNVSEEEKNAILNDEIKKAILAFTRE